MSWSAFFSALLRNPFGPACVPFARRAWCRRQRRHLNVPGHSVVWVRGETVSWAEWGARRKYFEVQQMDGLSYLRALGVPSA